MSEAAQARLEFRQTEAAFAAVRQGLIDAAIATGIGDSLARDKLILTIQCLDKVQQTLLSAAQTADLDAAAEEIRAALEG